MKKLEVEGYRIEVDNDNAISIFDYSKSGKETVYLYKEEAQRLLEFLQEHLAK